MLRDWIQVMPVDTSEAISNTQVGIGTPPLGPIPAHFLGRKGSTRGASGDRALSEGLETIKTKPPGKSLFISNTAGHIGDLDRGTSQQFGGGFIARARIVFHLAAIEAQKRLMK